MMLEEGDKAFREVSLKWHVTSIFMACVHVLDMLVQILTLNGTKVVRELRSWTIHVTTDDFTVAPVQFMRCCEDHFGHTHTIQPHMCPRNTKGFVSLSRL